MRIAVISDVHGNIHALDAVLEAIDADEVDMIWCLGDVVGYGARPNECCAAVAARARISLVGNHDLGVLGKIPLDVFAHEAAESARWTQTVLDDASRSYLAALSPNAETDYASLAHASPRDPIWEYVLGIDQARAALDTATRPLVLVGHSHAALYFENGASARWGLAPEGTVLGLEEGSRCLLNPGSVGQPRDGDPQAAWLLLDLDEARASFRRESYDVARTQAEIRDAGLPAELAQRLTGGS